MLVLLVGISGPRRWCSIIEDRPYFWGRTVSTAVGRHRAWPTVIAVWWRCDTRGGSTVVRICDSVRCLLLRLRRCWLRESLLSRITGCNIIHFRRWRWASNGSMAMLFLIRSHLLRTGTRLPRRGRRSDTITLIIGIGRLWLGMLNFSQTSTPVSRRTWWRRTRALWPWCTWSWYTPLWSRRSSHACCLILLRMHILRHRSTVLIRHASRLSIVPKKLQSCLDMDVHWVKVSRALISVQCVSGLIITRLVLVYYQPCDLV